MGTELYADWPFGELDEFHAFREKHYKYIYLCKSCSRSFETVSPTNRCKFCSGSIKRLAPIPKTDDYTLERDMKDRVRRILSGLIRWRRPKATEQGNQKTLHASFPIRQEKARKTSRVPEINFRIFSRNKEELPTR
jgi:DNA-directed RNA polymerase subunit RPC12/RpoP